MTFDSIALIGNWNYPTQIRFGAGRVDELGQTCVSMGIKNPLLVTDKGLYDLPIVDQAKQSCLNANLGIAVFKDVDPNPTGENISAGVQAYQDGKHDSVIAFGGGSSLDAGKAIALMVGQSRSIWDFEDIGDNWTQVIEENMAPVIAIPTTAGTGSEVGRASVIRDVANEQKKIIFHPKMLPALVIADPGLTVGLNPKVTAATGMDALSHNLEAFCAPGFHPLADGIAKEGMGLINKWLSVAVKEPDNLRARSYMLAASMMGATAFQKGLGAMHALAHPLGAVYDAHHGLLNAVLMLYVLKHNEKAIATSMTQLALSLELKSASFSGVLDWVLSLREEIGIPHSLKEIDIGKDRLAELANMAEQDPSSGGNPVKMDAKQYASILSNAIDGVL